jgi:thiamine biosynthesis protein ThiS
VLFVLFCELMRVFVNGDEKDLRDRISLAELIEQLDLPPARIAIELNREVVRRSDWGSTMLKDEDRIEIVHFVGGGEN